MPAVSPGFVGEVTVDIEMLGTATLCYKLTHCLYNHFYNWLFVLCKALWFTDRYIRHNLDQATLPMLELKDSTLSEIK